MDTSVIIALIGIVTTLIASGGWIATARGSAKKANNEAENAGIEGLKTALKTAEESNEAYRKQHKEDIEAFREYENLISDLKDEIARIKPYLCVHSGCTWRRPMMGGWDRFFAVHKNDDDMGVDFVTVQMLGKMNGYNVTPMKGEEARKLRMKVENGIVEEEKEKAESSESEQ